MHEPGSVKSRAKLPEAILPQTATDAHGAPCSGTGEALARRSAWRAAPQKRRTPWNGSCIGWSKIPKDPERFAGGFAG